MHNSVLNYHIEIVDSNTSVVIEDNSDRQMYSKIFYIHSTHQLEFHLTLELKQTILEILEDYFDINENNPFFHVCCLDGILLIQENNKQICE